MTMSDVTSSSLPSEMSALLHDTYSFLTEKDWLCLSFLTGIGPSRLSRLYTYLEQLGEGKGKNSSLSLSSTAGLFGEDDRQTSGPFEHHQAKSDQIKNHPTSADQTQNTITNPVSYDLLRSLKWPEVTAREAMAYLDHGQLTDEQRSKLDTSLAWLAEANHHIVFQHHLAYPESLKQITVAPTFLYVEGDLACLSLPKIGIVGARHCTGYGREATLQLAEQLSARGVCVVSGGARGIDTAAHQGVLNANGARQNESTSAPTIAVMGTGLLHRYPKQNRSLFDSILQHGGALISEYPLMTDVRAHLFPPRNRIISGLSAGVLVAEASPKSGSLISANYAVQQNREVFALPGRVFDSQAEGCHQLIRQGAILVRHVEDIINECPNLVIDPYLSMKDRASTNTQSPLDYPANQQDVSHETSHALFSDSSSKGPSSKSSSSKEQHKRKKVVSNEPPQASIKNALAPLPDGLSPEATAIAVVLEKETQALDFDALIRHTQLSAQDMMQALMELELSTCIVNYNGRYERC